VARAHAAFENFTLSSPAGPSRTVVSRSAERGAVHAAHREVMAQALDGLKEQNPARGGLVVALPKSEVPRLLGSLDEQASTVELSDVLAVAARHRTGAEFFAVGNPVINRLALWARARSLVDGAVDLQQGDPPASRPPAQEVGR
jgi:hypothetical protein